MEKDGFVTATKLGTTNNLFVAATKYFAAATKRFVDRTKHFVVVTKYFCYIPILTNDFVGITKPFFHVHLLASVTEGRTQKTGNETFKIYNVCGAPSASAPGNIACPVALATNPFFTVTSLKKEVRMLKPISD